MRALTKRGPAALPAAIAVARALAPLLDPAPASEQLSRLGEFLGRSFTAAVERRARDAWTAGRTLLARIASAAVQNAVSGTIQVGEVRGSLLTGVVLSDVRMWDPDSTLVAWLRRSKPWRSDSSSYPGNPAVLRLRLIRRSHWFGTFT